MNSYFSRVNHLYFEPPVKYIGDDKREVKIELYFSVCTYSSVGKAVRFYVNIKKNCIPNVIASILIDKELTGKYPTPNQAQKIAKKIREDIPNALDDFVREDDAESSMQSPNIEETHLENPVNDCFFKKRMKTSCRLKSTQNIRSYKSTENDPIYDSYNMFTGTHVIKCMELGIYSPIMTTGKVSKNQRIVLNNQGSV